MTNEDRVRLFQLAVLAIEKLEREYPSYPPFESIHNQLLFLLNQASGQPADRDGLIRINLGVITVREVEPVDDSAAGLFYLVSAAAKEMLREASRMS
jgi:hypothetical protein